MTGISTRIIGLLLVCVCAVYSSALAQVKISELMYHPPAGDLEFVEFYNPGPTAIDLTGWTISDGVQYEFPTGVSIPADGRVVVAEDKSTLALITGLDPASILGDYTGAFANGGERVAISNAQGDVVDEFTFSDAPPFDPAADGRGSSLERLCFTADPALPGNWRASVVGGGTPLAPNSVTGCPPPPPPSFSPVVINEIHYHPGGVAEPGPEFFELYNRAIQSLDLHGWRIGGGVDLVFDRAAGPTVIPAQGYLLVAGDPAAVAGVTGIPANEIAGPYTGRLSNFSDRLRLFNDAGREVETVEYQQDGLWPASADGFGPSLQRVSTEISGLLPGNWKIGVEGGCAEVADCVLVENGATVRWFENRDGTDPGFSGGLNWFHPDFDATANGFSPGQLAVGYDTSAASAPGWINTWTTSVPGLHSILVRVEFDYDPNDPARNCPSDLLSLFMDWDDGAIAWLNGVEVTRQGMPGNPGDVPAFDGVYRADVITASGDQEDEPVYRQVWQGNVSDLLTGRNVLAIGSYNSRDTSSDLFASALLTIGEVAGASNMTPGSRNSVASSIVPPLVTELDWSPRRPTPSDSVTVTAVVDGADIASVELFYDGGSGEQRIDMRDDGVLPDDIADDRIYRAIVPAMPDQTLVRLRVVASDSTGCNTLMPREGNPSPYTGYFVVADLPEFNEHMRLFYIFTPGALLDLSCTEGVYRQGSLVDHTGRAYFDVGVKHRGETACNFPKRPMRVRFNKGDLFEGQSKLNFNAGYQDKSMMREEFGFDLFCQTGVGHSETHFARVHTNGGNFHGAYFTVEDPLSPYLRRNRRDAGGALYKVRTAMLNGSTSGYESRTDSGPATLPAVGSFATQLNSLSGQPLIDFLNTNLNVEEFIDYQAVQVIIIDGDSVVKNWLLYVGHNELLDQDGPGHDGSGALFSVFPWDIDLSWGQMYLVTDERHFNIHPLFQTQTYPFVGQGHHGIVNALLQRAPNDYYVKAYYGRMWTLLQEKFSPDILTPRFDAYDVDTRAVAQADLNRWRRQYGSRATDLAFWRNDVRNFIRNRHNYLTNYLTANNPTTSGRRFQYTPPPRIKITEIHYNPQNDELLEFIEFRSLETEAVDISGWNVPAVDYEFPPGSVIPAEGFFILARDPDTFAAFHGDVDPPVFGPYTGALSNGGEVIRLRDNGRYNGRDYYPETIDMVIYLDEAPWPVDADGEGHSLELLDLELDNDFATSWQASVVEGGSPGALTLDNLPPVAQVTVEPRIGSAPLRVTFNASASFDPDGDPFTASWDFGDGIIGAGLELTHRYRDPGIFIATLTLDDGISRAVTREFVIEVLDGSVVRFIRGEVNNDGRVDIADAVRVLFHIFRGDPVTCPEAVDVDGNGQQEVTDAIFILNYLFASGAAPGTPFPACGGDPDPPGFGCTSSTCP